MSALKELMVQKGWSVSELTRNYGAVEEPELEANEAVKKYGSMIRNALSDPSRTKYATVKCLVELLGGELVIKVKREEELHI